MGMLSHVAPDGHASLSSYISIGRLPIYLIWSRRALLQAPALLSASASPVALTRARNEAARADFAVAASPRRAGELAAAMMYDGRNAMLGQRATRHTTYFQEHIQIGFVIRR